MNRYYKFLRSNLKILMISSFAVVLHVGIIYHAKSDYSYDLLVEEQKPSHFKLQSLLSMSLKNNCDYSVSDLKKVAKTFGLDLSVSTSNIVSIDDIEFKRLIFTSTKSGKVPISYSTDGLLVVHKDDCFGLI